jgi:hypothetical protein
MRRGCTGAAGPILAALTGSACHVVTRTTTTVPGVTERILHREGAVARRPALVITDLGQLRFIEPLECPSEELVHSRTTTEVVTGPNLATFTVGVIATALGGVMLTSGLFSSRPGASPYTYAGLTGASVGLPFVIGPWLGNRTELREARDRSDGDPLHGAGDRGPVAPRPGPGLPCGERPLAATSATLDVSGIEVQGAVDRDGVFSISPFAWTDAYAAAAASPAAITARVEAAGGARTVAAVLDAGSLARHAAAFLARADFDARVEPLKLVPGIVAGVVRVSLITTEHGSELRVALPLRNDGPGDSWGLRGQLTAPAAPALDGRMIYVGKLARGAVITRELAIPLAPAAASALRDATVELAVELRDAHGTAPTAAVRFRGRVRGDSTR